MRFSISTAIKRSASSVFASIFSAAQRVFSTVCNSAAMRETSFARRGVGALASAVAAVLSVFTASRIDNGAAGFTAAGAGVSVAAGDAVGVGTVTGAAVAVAAVFFLAGVCFVVSMVFYPLTGRGVRSRRRMASRGVSRCPSIGQG